MAANPTLLALRRQPIDKGALGGMELAVLLALSEVDAGTAGPSALADLQDALGIAVELVRLGIGCEALALLRQAQAVLHRAAAGGLPLRVHGPELRVLRDACAAAHSQRQLCSVGEFQAASAMDDALRRSRRCTRRCHDARPERMRR